MRLIAKQLHCSILFCLLSLSLLSPVWIETQRLQGKLQRSKLVRARVDWRCGLQTFCCWQRRVRARWANQLAPTSPVAKQHRVDRRIRTECTESVTDLSVKPSFWWQRKYHGKNGLLETSLAVNGVIFQTLSHCLIRFYIIMTKLSQKSFLVSL